MCAHLARAQPRRLGRGQAGAPPTRAGRQGAVPSAPCSHTSLKSFMKTCRPTAAHHGPRRQEGALRGHFTGNPTAPVHSTPPTTPFPPDCKRSQHKQGCHPYEAQSTLALAEGGRLAEGMGRGGHHTSTMGKAYDAGPAPTPYTRTCFCLILMHSHTDLGNPPTTHRLRRHGPNIRFEKSTAPRHTVFMLQHTSDTMSL